MSEPILVSACLLGAPCRYDGCAKPNQAVIALLPDHRLIPFCPEISGGLPTPREPAEIRVGKVVTCAGQDVTQAYRLGAAEALRLADLFGCRCAILKEKSPSCGKGCIHDGSFSGKLVPGNGVTAALLLANGIRVYGETDVENGTFFRQSE